MRYANHECAKCGVVLPANELAVVTDDVFTGSTRYQRRSHGTLRPGGRADRFARRRSRLCRKCLTKRRVGQLAFISIAAVLFAPALAIPLIGGSIILFLLFAMRRWLGLIVVSGAVALAATWMIGGRPLQLLRGAGTAVASLVAKSATTHHTSSRSASQQTAEGDEAPTADITPSARPAHHTAFGPIAPVVQAIPPAATAYPPCSATVTDRCVDR